MNETQFEEAKNFIGLALEDLCREFRLPFDKVFYFVKDEIFNKKELTDLMIFRDDDTDKNPINFPLGGPGTFLNGSVIYALIRYLNCKKVIETGVANGYYTSFLLSAVIENDGFLESVELSNNLNEVAKYVPEKYKKYNNWKLNCGHDSVNFLKNIKQMDYDFYCHDSLHTTYHMTKELLQFKRCDRDNFYIFFDDQNDDNFWTRALNLKLFKKNGYDMKLIEGKDTKLQGHLGGFLSYWRH